jgi:hypothetical protein
MAKKPGAKANENEKPKTSWHSNFGNWAQIASATISLIGFAVVVYQINESREKAAHDAIRAELGDARRLYLTYSDATLRYPELTKPNYSILVKNYTEFVRYENFVSHMLYAYDDILNAVRQYEQPIDVAAWEESFKMDVKPHRRYFCHQLNTDFFNQFRKDMKERISKIVEPCKDVEPIEEPAVAPAHPG